MMGDSGLRPMLSLDSKSDLEVSSMLLKRRDDFRLADEGTAESPCPFVVRQILDGLDDDEDDPELKTGATSSSTTATPSADSGFFGGGASPTASSAGGDSPAPSTTPQQQTQAAAAQAQPPPQQLNNDLLSSSVSVGSLFTPRDVGPFSLGGSPADPSMDMKMLEQAVQLVQMGFGVESGSGSSPIGPSGDGYGGFDGGFGSFMAAAGGDSSDTSNFANNLRALASLESYGSVYGPPPPPAENRYSLPVYSSPHNRYESSSSCQRQYDYQRYGVGVPPRYHQDDLHRFEGAVSPFRSFDARSNFRGSNGSLSGGDNWSSGSLADGLSAFGLSRLEMNKGGMGKSPYAGIFADVCPTGSSLDPMQIRCKFGQLGQGQGQFNSPHGFCLSANEEIVVADTHNHRIQIFDKAGNFKFMFGNQGKAEGCLWYPRKVAVLKHNGNFVVCDRGGERSRMQIFNQYGQFSHSISIRFIDIVAGLAISQEGHIVAVDSVTPTIFILSEDGRLLRYHECSEFMKEPSDIGIFGRNYYICDFKDHNVVVVSEDGKLLRKIGNDRVTCFPNGIDISDAGDVLIGDSHGNKFHVAVYDKDAALASQFECPNVKVSRCCGLKITSEGYIVTLAKNNHHVLVLNTIYIS